MELILRIELKTSPLPRECSTAELYERILHKPVGFTKKNITKQHIIIGCRDELFNYSIMLCSRCHIYGAGGGNRTRVISLEG